MDHTDSDYTPCYCNAFTNTYRESSGEDYRGQNLEHNMGVIGCAYRDPDLDEARKLTNYVAQDAVTTRLVGERIAAKLAPFGVRQHDETIGSAITLGGALDVILEHVLTVVHPPFTDERVINFSRHTGRTWQVTVIEESRVQSYEVVLS